MKIFLAIMTLMTLFCINAFCSEKKSSDGFIYHKACWDGDFRPDTSSVHKYESKIFKGVYANGYCTVTL